MALGMRETMRMPWQVIAGRPLVFSSVASQETVV